MNTKQLMKVYTTVSTKLFLKTQTNFQYSAHLSMQSRGQENKQKNKHVNKSSEDVVKEQNTEDNIITRPIFPKNIK